MHSPWCHFSRNGQKRCCWNCNIWPDWFTCHQSCLIGLLATNHAWLVYLPPITLLLILFQWYTEVYEKTFNVSKIAQTTQNMWNNISLSESQVYKKWQTLVIIWEIQSQVSTLERFPNQKGTNNMKFGVWGAHGVFVIERSSPLGKVWLY